MNMTGIEDRYAYYRRCRVLRRNGEQCKAPAMKGTHICYKHLERAEMEERWKRQRQELLARPGLGFGDSRSIQRTIGAAAQAMIDGSIDLKVAGRLLLELQTTSKLLRNFTAMNADQRSRASDSSHTENMKKQRKIPPAYSHPNCATAAQLGAPNSRADDSARSLTAVGMTTVGCASFQRGSEKNKESDANG